MPDDIQHTLYSNYYLILTTGGSGGVFQKVLSCIEALKLYACVFFNENQLRDAVPGNGAFALAASSACLFSNPNILLLVEPPSSWRNYLFKR